MKKYNCLESFVVSVVFFVIFIIVNQQLFAKGIREEYSDASENLQKFDAEFYYQQGLEYFENGERIQPDPTQDFGRIRAVDGRW